MTFKPKTLHTTPKQKISNNTPIFGLDNKINKYHDNKEFKELFKRFPNNRVLQALNELVDVYCIKPINSSVGFGPTIKVEIPDFTLVDEDSGISIDYQNSGIYFEYQEDYFSPLFEGNKTHPHVDIDGSICFGDQSIIANQMIINYRLSALLDLVSVILRKYNKDDAIFKIEEIEDLQNVGDYPNHNIFGRIENPNRNLEPEDDDWYEEDFYDEDEELEEDEDEIVEEDNQDLFGAPDIFGAT